MSITCHTWFAISLDVVSYASWHRVKDILHTLYPTSWRRVTLHLDVMFPLYKYFTTFVHVSWHFDGPFCVIFTTLHHFACLCLHFCIVLCIFHTFALFYVFSKFFCIIVLVYVSLCMVLCTFVSFSMVLHNCVDFYTILHVFVYLSIVLPHFTCIHTYHVLGGLRSL